jgi:hypothetical protein
MPMKVKRNRCAGVARCQRCATVALWRLEKYPDSMPIKPNPGRAAASKTTNAQDK